MVSVGLALLLFVFAIGTCKCSRMADEAEQKELQFDRAYRQRHNKLPSAAERFRFFDEYLLSIKLERGSVSPSNEEDPSQNRKTGAGRKVGTENGGDQEKTMENVLLDRIRNERTNPKFACCALGQIAGNHGFHCNAKFYENRIQMRNRNRAQTKQTALDEIERQPDYNEHLWNTFGNCVRKHARSFHHCCYAARVLGSESVDLYNFKLRAY